MKTEEFTAGRDEKMIAGVCGGLAEWLDLDPSIVRLIFVLLGLTFGHGILVYLYWHWLCLWIIKVQTGSPNGGFRVSLYLRQKQMRLKLGAFAIYHYILSEPITENGLVRRHKQGRIGDY